MHLSETTLEVVGEKFFPLASSLYALTMAGLRSRCAPLSFRDGSLLEIDQEGARELAELHARASAAGPSEEIATLLAAHFPVPSQERYRVLCQLHVWVETLRVPWGPSGSGVGESPPVLVSLPLVEGMVRLLPELLVRHSASTGVSDPPSFLVPHLAAEGLRSKAPSTTVRLLANLDEDPALWETALTLWAPRSGSTLATLKGAFDAAGNLLAP